MPTFSIRSRLIFLFTLQIIIIIFAGGLYLDWRLRQTLENELADKLESLAKTMALQIDADLLQNIFPGDEETRTYKNILQQLETFKRQTNVRRIYLFLKNKKIAVDTDLSAQIGNDLFFLPITPEETEALFSGQTINSTLFEGSDGLLYKTSFTPILAGEQVSAALALEASAHTLDAIQTVRRDLFILGIVVLVGSVFIGFLFSKRITTPLNRLKAAAKKITKGDYESKIQIKSSDEIGFLGQTMEEMRRAIVQRDTRQKTMLAGVAHEIRNPLGGIELFAGLLASELTDEKPKNEAKKIQKEVQNLKKIVNNFLNYARPSKAKKENCVVKDIFEEAKLLMAQDLNGYKVEFIEDKKNSRIFIDPQHLKQIFLNLMKNSVEALQGSGTIKLEIKGPDKLDFSDSGPGIPNELHEQVFEPFFTQRKDGTGLGLAIVKSLVEENGGEIRLVQNINSGAKFEFSFSKPLY
ncbi:HAMP domain-containing protein [candidate division KSB1 bacterium]|nr:HAMP domain-containing protein [candidate division KSB1 bacterium]